MTSDPHSKIVSAPTDQRGITVSNLFFTIPFIYGQNGLTGFDYAALKDVLKWNNLSVKDFVPLFLSAMNHYIVGIHDR